MAEGPLCKVSNPWENVQVEMKCYPEDIGHSRETEREGWGRGRERERELWGERERGLGRDRES